MVNEVIVRFEIEFVGVVVLKTKLNTWKITCGSRRTWTCKHVKLSVGKIRITIAFDSITNEIYIVFLNEMVQNISNLNILRCHVNVRISLNVT